MKSKILILTLAIVSFLSHVSCSSDDDKSVNISNSYEYDGAKTQINWAGYYESTGSGYSFGLAPAAPTGNLSSATNFFSFDIPVERLNQTLDLSQNLDGADWYFYGTFRHQNYTYYINDLTNSSESTDDVTGTDNWIKVTKNTSGPHNFTVQFSMTVNGKTFKGSYKGDFRKYEEYSDVGIGS